MGIFNPFCLIITYSDVYSDAVLMNSTPTRQHTSKPVVGGFLPPNKIIRDK